MDIQNTTQFTFTEALAMYERLRQRGQSGLLARLSVEARCGGSLTPQQRRHLREILSGYENAKNG
jgi:hypothetical protein